MANQLNEVPASLEPMAELSLGDRKFGVYVTAVWYKFFVSLSGVLSNLIGGVLGFTSENGITATGTTQADAFVAQTEWVIVSTTPLNSGVVIDAFGAGVASTVFNQGANPLKVYPPVGYQIDALGLNNPYTLAANKVQVFSQTDDTKFTSMQLG